jgi:anti-anti-sigma factor
MTFPEYPPDRAGQSFIALDGSLDDGGTAELRDRLSAAAQGTPHDLTIDMRGVSSISHGALAVLVGARSRQKSLDRQLTLIYRSGSVTEQALRLAGMQARFLTVRDTA